MTETLYDGLILYACLLFSLCVHEAAHAAMANWRGDPTGRLLGRVTLNPIAHIDIMGTVVLPIILLFSGGFLLGWAKPVPFNPANLKNIRRDPVLVALAGPLSNLLIVVGVVLLLRITFLVVDPMVLNGSPVLFIAARLILLNLALMCFNLIPVPPLDGHHVLFYFLPESAQRALSAIGPFGILIAMLVAFRFLQGPLAFLFGIALWAVGA